MFKALKNTSRGFSLIELLTVISILGILSAIVLAAMSSSRAKSRDGKRVSEVTQIQRALELYFDLYQTYPSSTPGNADFVTLGCANPSPGTDVALQLLRCRNRFAQLPVPPGGGGDARYVYKGIKSVGVECVLSTDRSCVSYAIGAGLERSDYVALKNDADQSLTTVFYGSSGGSCVANTAGSDKCFDLKP